ncbi:MAG: hypothetical protein ABIA76_05275 [Candidatus Diapherotrites archaeon]
MGKWHELKTKVKGWFGNKPEEPKKTQRTRRSIRIRPKSEDAANLGSRSKISWELDFDSLNGELSRNQRFLSKYGVAVKFLADSLLYGLDFEEQLNIKVLELSREPGLSSVISDRKVFEAVIKRKIIVNLREEKWFVRKFVDNKREETLTQFRIAIEGGIKKLSAHQKPTDFFNDIVKTQARPFALALYSLGYKMDRVTGFLNRTANEYEKDLKKGE